MQYSYQLQPESGILTGINLFDKRHMPGLPKGKIIEIFGQSDCGKTEFCLNLLKNLQLDDHIVAYFNIDNNISLDFLRHHSLDFSKTVLINSNDPETILDFLKDLCLNNLVSCIVLDSITNLHTDENKIMKNCISGFLKQVSQYIYGKNVSVICINQYRYKKHKNRFVLTDAWHDIFDVFCSLKIKFKKRKMLYDANSHIVGMQSSVSIIKDKTCNSLKTMLYNYSFFKDGE